MYHYEPTTALEELNEEALLPNPVYMRDMILRAHVGAERSTDLNRLFLEYQKNFADAQRLARSILNELARR